MVSLRFFGGINEIGGNKILLQDKDVRIWLDFGQSFTLGNEYFIDWLRPRPTNELGDLLEFDLLPRLEGLYAEHLLNFTDLNYFEPRYDGVFISHAHFDHVNHIRFMDSRVPIFTGSGTKLFMEAMEKTSTYCKYGNHDYRSFRTGDRIEIGDLVIEPIHVDHSIPAAYGFIIHSSKGVIVYTGDFRAHGPRMDMTEEFLELASKAEPIALITEGTRISRREKRENLSESQVLNGVIKICEESDQAGKIVLYAHGPRDMDRLRTFYTAAKKCGRHLIITTKTAHLLHRLIEDEHLDLPDPLKDDYISVYFRRKKTGEYDDKDYYIWERDFLGNIITAEELKAKPEKYVVNIDFYSFTELIDIRPESGSHFIYSMSEAFNEEDIEEKIMHNWLKHYGLVYHQLHASGHLSRTELVDAIEKVRPEKIFPVFLQMLHDDVACFRRGATTAGLTR